MPLQAGLSLYPYFYGKMWIPLSDVMRTAKGISIEKFSKNTCIIGSIIIL